MCCLGLFVVVYKERCIPVSSSYDVLRSLTLNAPRTHLCVRPKVTRNANDTFMCLLQFTENLLSHRGENRCNTRLSRVAGFCYFVYHSSEFTIDLLGGNAHTCAQLQKRRNANDYARNREYYGS